tara:strand:+ start:3110 stop:4858 length:1749 start_codon:yes stop_codon:yes gene_type:complete
MEITEKRKNYFFKVFALVVGSKLRLAVMPVYFIFSSILDLISVGLIGSYIGFIINKNFLESENFYLFLDLWSSFINVNNYIISIGILLVLIFTIKSILSIFIHRQIIKFSHETQANLRHSLMSSYRSMNYSDYLKRDSSEYINAVGTLVKNFGGGLTACIQCFGDIIITIVLVGLLIAISGTHLFFLACALVIIIFFYKVFFLNDLDQYGKKLNESYSQMYQSISEYFFGFKELKILNSFDSFEKKIINSTKQIAVSDIRQSFITTIPRFLLELILIIFITSIISFAVLNEQNIELLLPTISIFAAASLRLVPIAYQFTRYIGAFKYSEDSVNRLYKDLEKNNYYKVENHTNAEQYNNDFNELDLVNVNFTYGKQKIYMLKNINLKITNGKAIAISGPSGSGKTTILNLILGLISPIDGQIFYNKKDLNLNIDNWRNQVAYIPQETFLINDTIRANIALGINSEEIDDYKIQECIDKVHLRDFVKNLKNGIETNVSERGLSISGGQRQRIAFARAFYFNRNILILDEPTSSIDLETEKEIIDYLSELKGSKTIIIISHKLDSIKFCDHVYEIKENTLKIKED